MSITPKQAFEAAKILWPSIKTIKRIQGTNDWYSPDTECESPIAWGSDDQYPPLGEEWVDAVFPRDVGKEGRFSDSGTQWYTGQIRGQLADGRWVRRNAAYNYCQVKKEQAS